MRVLFISLTVLVVDQITKLIVKCGLSLPFLGIEIKPMVYGTSIRLVGNLLKFTYIENPGMAFGIELGGKLTLSIFTLIATLLIIYFIYKNRKESLLLRAALAIILGGALGNLVDRIFYGVIFNYAPLFYGKVVDFIHIDIPDVTVFGKTFYSWPILNIADLAVTTGFIMILFGYKKIFIKSKEIDLKEKIESENISENHTN